MTKKHWTEERDRAQRMCSAQPQFWNYWNQKFQHAQGQLDELKAQECRTREERAAARRRSTFQPVMASTVILFLAAWVIVGGFLVPAGSLAVMGGLLGIIGAGGLMVSWPAWRRACREGEES